MSDWTRDRTEELKTLWAEGLSCSQIAWKLGGITRNAVIGKATRLKLPERIRISGKSGRRVRGFMKSEKVCAVPLPEKPMPKGEPEFIGPLNDFPVGGCRYIKGDPGRTDWRCCGARQVDVGSPYCAYHHAVCFSKSATAAANDRARAKEAARLTGSAKVFG